MSTLSADSGNVHDYIESSEAKHYFPKSKSMPNYGDLQTVEPYAIQSKQAKDFCNCELGRIAIFLATFVWSSALQTAVLFLGHSSRTFGKESLSNKTGSLRKTLTDLSDSGVSVVSETPSCQIKDR